MVAGLFIEVRMQKAEHAPSREELLALRPIPCICRVEADTEVKLQSIRGELPVAEVQCQVCPRRWKRVG